MTTNLKDLYYEYAIKLAYDIVEHLPTLYKYGKECSHITEFGTRFGYSTCAFLFAEPKKLISYDIDEKIEFITKAKIISKENNIDFIFNREDVLNVKIEATDLLFIDTFHTYNQLKQELKLHADKVKKYIIMHDTEIYKNMGEDKSIPGLMMAISEYLNSNKNWKIKENYSNNFGLTILEKQ